MSKIDKFKEITQVLADTYEKKNHDYGDSFGISIQKYGPIAALTRISDKFNRLESLMLKKEQKVNDESIQDTLLDMANYCIMTYMELTQRSDTNEKVDNLTTPYNKTN